MTDYENKTIRKNFLLPGSLDEELRRVSFEKHMSQNEIVNKALRAYLKRFNTNKED